MLPFFIVTCSINFIYFNSLIIKMKITDAPSQRMNKEDEIKSNYELNKEQYLLNKQGSTGVAIGGIRNSS